MVKNLIRFWLHFAGGTTLGPDKIDLLEQIELSAPLGRPLGG